MKLEENKKRKLIREKRRKMMINITENENPNLIKEIIQCLNENLNLEKIHKKYIANFTSLTNYFAFIQDEILHVFGEDNFRSYIRRYYIRMYNNEFKWKNPYFSSFWNEIADANMLRYKKTSIVFNIFKEEHNKVISQFLNIPESFFDELKYSIDKHLAIPAHKYGYKDQTAYSTFIDEYFSNRLNSEQIYDYGKAMLEKYLSTHRLFNYNEFVKYCFGDKYSKGYLEKTSCKLIDVFRYITLPYRYKRLEYKTIIDILDKVNITKEEKENYLHLKNLTTLNNNLQDINIVNEKLIWDNYTEEEVKKRLDDAFDKLKEKREKIASTKIFKVLYNLPFDVSEKYCDIIINRGKNSEIIKKYIREKKLNS